VVSRVHIWKSVTMSDTSRHSCYYMHCLIYIKGLCIFVEWRWVRHVACTREWNCILDFSGKRLLGRPRR
jgi:hypothetical protein